MSSLVPNRRVLLVLGAFCLMGAFVLSLRASPQQVTASAPVAAPGLTVNSNGGHIQTNVANSDIAGTFTTSGTTGTVTFNTAYTRRSA